MRRKIPHFRLKSQVNKKSGCPNGISRTWRKYEEGRSAYLEYQVSWRDHRGKRRITHFYVGVNPTLEKEVAILKKAIKFRKDFEAGKRCVKQ